MKAHTICERLATAATAVGLLIGAGPATAVPGYGPTTDNYCRSVGRPRAAPTDCNECHLANMASRKKPQWSWYQAAPKGASAQMRNFCPPGRADKAPDTSNTARTGNQPSRQPAP